MIVLLIILLIPFNIHAGQSARMQEENQFEDTAELVTLFNRARRGEGGDQELRKLAATMSLEDLEVMNKACNYAHRERKKALLCGEQVSKSLLELRALERDLKCSYHYEQTVAQRSQEQRMNSISSTGLRITMYCSLLVAAASYVCCGGMDAPILMSTGCACLSCLGVTSCHLCLHGSSVSVPTQTEQDHTKARKMVEAMEKDQQTENSELKTQWKESLQAKKME